MSRRRRTAAALSAAAIALPALLLPAVAAAQPTDPTVLAGASAYLVDQLDPDSALVENQEFGFTDHGLTADIVLALVATGAAPDQVDATVSALAATDQVDAYVTGGSEGDRYAGSFAKLSLTLQAGGLDPTDLDGRDLLAELGDLAAPADDPEAGRFRDDSEFGDFSSVTTQSLAVLAYTAAGRDLPEGAVDLLLGDQCDTGGFTNAFGDADCIGEPDATGFALQALVAVGADDAAAAAAGWLEEVQGDDGSFEAIDDDGNPIANANSTALASQGLTAAGADTAAARSFLAGLQDADSCGLAYADGDDEAGDRATAQAVPALAETTLLALATSDHEPVGVEAACGGTAAADPTDAEEAGDDDAEDGTAEEAGAQELDAEPEGTGRVFGLAHLLIVLVLALIGLWLATRRSRSGAEG